MDLNNSKIKRIIRTRKERTSIEEICLTTNDSVITIITTINDAQVLIVNVNAIA
jgi:hypothetical protein